VLVDPGKLTMNFDPPPSFTGAGGVDDHHAEGVVTVALTVTPPAEGKGGREGNVRCREGVRVMCVVGRT
jgi:hypothetical protein